MEKHIFSAEGEFIASDQMAGPTYALKDKPISIAASGGQ